MHANLAPALRWWHLNEHPFPMAVYHLIAGINALIRIVVVVAAVRVGSFRYCGT